MLSYILIYICLTHSFSIWNMTFRLIYAPSPPSSMAMVFFMDMLPLVTSTP